MVPGFSNKIDIVGVIGSSPTNPTKKKQILHGSVFSWFWVSRLEPMTTGPHDRGGESSRRLPVAEISSAAFSCETSDLSSGQSRRLSMRNIGSIIGSDSSLLA